MQTRPETKNKGLFKSSKKFLKETVQTSLQEQLDKAQRDATYDCICKTVDILKDDIGISDEDIIMLLQRYYDLRRSEVVKILEIKRSFEKFTCGDLTKKD